MMSGDTDGGFAQNPEIATGDRDASNTPESEPSGKSTTFSDEVRFIEREIQVNRRRNSQAGRAPATRADRKSEAEAAMAAFLSKGGAVKQVPSVVPTMFACSECGHARIAGMTEGKTTRCPRCRQPLT